MEFASIWASRNKRAELQSDAIQTLLGKYEEQRCLHLLFNPDGFPRIYVYKGDGFPLVTLQHKHLRPEAPACSCKEANERFKKHKSGFRQA
ncbi:hypothetical protein FAZ95_03315 [Trinickia violacea]|uniref:Uncharacterized protein n=1 Tax=Trinickia violacea TaxID=2571746 RepID=A0A4P8IKQ0_9BURK|nr:hypothetical protein [Trinickia violacea]QCP48297.1 hypothetical protein FAZ95_03315 [Trinickia violacea]